MCFLVPGISAPRVSMGAHALPSGARVARAIQTAAPPHQHMYVSSLLSAWGGMLLRDLVKTVNPKLEKVKILYVITLMNLYINRQQIAVISKRIWSAGSTESFYLSYKYYFLYKLQMQTVILLYFESKW